MRKINARNSGFTTVTGMLLLVIAVMLITTFANIMQSAILQTAFDSFDIAAQSAAMSGVYYAASSIIDDTPSTKVNTADIGVVLTEIHSRAEVNNYLSNGDLDDWTGGVADNWSETGTAASIVQEATVVRTGSSCEFTNPTGAYSARGIGHLGGSASPNEVLTYGVYAYVDVVAGAAANSQLLVVLSFYNSAGTYIGADTDVDGNFVAGNTWNLYSGTATCPANTATVKLYIAGKETVNNDNEIYVDDAYVKGTSDRKMEFIEIQNSDSVVVNLVTGDYWISVGDPSVAAGTRRRIFPLKTGGQDTLGIYHIGCVVALDADTPSIAALSGVTQNDIVWFGLGPAGGAAVDTQLGFTRPLEGRGDTVVIGRGANGLSGSAFEPSPFSSIATTETYSVQKLTLSSSAQDDTVTPFNYYNSTNWETKPATPGAAFSYASGATDGAPDTWYKLANDSYIALGDGKYFRIRVYDESGKIPINNTNSGMQIKWILQNFLMTKPNPPFSDGGTTISINDTDDIALVTADMSSNSAAWAHLLTPSSAAFLRISGSPFHEYRVPYVTVYGYSETDAKKINVNTAESPVLEAAIAYACSTAAIPRADLFKLGSKIYSYLTNSDTNVTNDNVYNSVQEIATKTTGLTTTEKTALTNNLTALSNTFRTSSTGYFTIHATGYLFGAGANLDVDQPKARAVVVAVIRRSQSAKKGEIVFWREIMDDEKTRYSIGTYRHPIFDWDPNDY